MNGILGKSYIRRGKLNQYIKVFLENVNIRQFKETRAAASVVSYISVCSSVYFQRNGIVVEKLYYIERKFHSLLYSVQVSNVESE